MIFLGQVQNWLTLGQKLGHQAKSKENLVNTLTLWRSYFPCNHMNLVYLNDFRSNLKLGHLCHISWSSDFVFPLGQFLINCWSNSTDTWHLDTCWHDLLNAVIHI